RVSPGAGWAHRVHDERLHRRRQQVRRIARDAPETVRGRRRGTSAQAARASAVRMSGLPVGHDLATAEALLREIATDLMSLPLDAILGEVDDVLAGLALTERTRELQLRAADCRAAVQALQGAPTEERRAVLRDRITKLLEEARITAERGTGPHSQKIQIV